MAARQKRRSATALTACMLGGLAFGVATAEAWVYSGIPDFNLTEAASAYNGGPYSISSGGDGSAAYRWVDDPPHSTVISGNNCGDKALLGGPASIGAHDVSYHGLFGGRGSGFCFILAGRTAAGAGSMSNYDGQLRR